MEFSSASQGWMYLHMLAQEECFTESHIKYETGLPDQLGSLEHTKKKRLLTMIALHNFVQPLLY